MRCLKCGREIDEDQYFCGDCLLDMGKYPVKPGTAVQLPPRRESAPPRKSHFRRRIKLTPEDQLKTLKVRVRVLSVLLAVCLILLVVFAIPAIKYLAEDHILPGQNYSAVGASGSADVD